MRLLVVFSDWTVGRKTLVALGLLLPMISFAQAGDEEERMPVETWSQEASVTPDRAQRRLYPGGRDEQDLKVQPSLPQPTRSFEAMQLPMDSSEEARD